MSRIYLVAVLAMLMASCATSEFEKRAQQISAGERIIPRVDVDHPEAAELRFQLAILRFDQADALGKADAGSAARDDFVRALELLKFVLEHYPAYERRAEVSFWRAETLSRLGWWTEAAEAWRTVDPQQSLENQSWAKRRLQQALCKTNQCGEADAGAP